MKKHGKIIMLSLVMALMVTSYLMGHNIRSIKPEKIKESIEQVAKDSSQQAEKVISKSVAKSLPKYDEKDVSEAGLKARIVYLIFQKRKIEKHVELDKGYEDFYKFKRGSKEIKKMIVKYKDSEEHGEYPRGVVVEIKESYISMFKRLLFMEENNLRSRWLVFSEIAPVVAEEIFTENYFWRFVYNISNGELDSVFRSEGGYFYEYDRDSNLTAAGLTSVGEKGYVIKCIYKYGKLLSVVSSLPYYRALNEDLYDTIALIIAPDDLKMLFSTRIMLQRYVKNSGTKYWIMTLYADNKKLFYQINEKDININNILALDAVTLYFLFSGSIIDSRFTPCLA